MLPLLLAAVMQFFPNLLELSHTTSHQNSDQAQDLQFLLGQMHQRGKREGQ